MAVDPFGFIPFKKYVNAGGNTFACTCRSSKRLPLHFQNMQCIRGWIH